MVENVEGRKYVYGALHLVRAFDNYGHLKFETVIVNEGIVSSFFVAEEEIEKLTGIRYGRISVGMLEKEDFLKRTKEILQNGGVVPDAVLDFEGLRDFARKVLSAEAANPS